MSDQKSINIIVSEALHLRVKAKAAEMGITLQAGYADALERWVDPGDPASELTISELRMLGSFMRRPIDEFDSSLRNHLLLVFKAKVFLITGELKMSITKDEVYEQESLSQVLAKKDIHLYFRILSGEPVPAGVDVEALMARVDLWERQQIFEIADAEKGSYWWVGVLAMCIWDSWRRKATEALRAGKSWRAITTTGQSLMAFWATFLLVLRQILFPFSPITLQPLRRVIAFTAA